MPCNMCLLSALERHLLKLSSQVRLSDDLSQYLSFLLVALVEPAHKQQANEQY